MFGEKEVDSETYGKWSLKYSPEVDYKLIHGESLTFTQNSKGFGELGSHIWDAGIVLARYLETFDENGKTWRKGESEVEYSTPYCRGKSIIELGSGIGLTGTVASIVGADIILTDKPALIDLITHNLKKNTVGKVVHALATPFLWGSENNFGRDFDIILAADLTYDIEDIPLLVHTFLSLSNHNTQIWLAYGKERFAMGSFFDQVQKFYTVENVPTHHLISDDISFPISTIEIAKLRKIAK